jgi:AraC-like DNA-binding protein
MEMKEWTQLWRQPQLDLELLQAFYVDHAFPRHAHDYYVVGLILRGRQSFTHRGAKYYTPPGGLILINPDEPHTGEAVDEHGFEMLCMYPTAAHMQSAVSELTGHTGGLPYFKDVRVDPSWLNDRFLAMHRALTQGASPLECESRFTQVLIQLITRYADGRLSVPPLGRERKAVQQARRYLDEGFAQDITLTQLAAHVSLSPYYLLRVFRAEVGMPPYGYLESVRIRQAQRLIKAGRTLAETAVEVGFNSQSHLTYRFKQIIGVTPGQYAQRLKESYAQPHR